ncbi:WD40 repeat-like protein [Aspergillus campestris IBT 28561]|uniref:Probable E3 ubiquitin ligase complex SCF subunit sconB n=1 Tax=Aspergillus campestris (strain IBT 28561) TaxID=1392248 RepID=A0A2I1CY71_ASPC2|nr:WD40 repeat-like protein [Aspergillus campestris IBT 28561]PKY02568.1 WD40 repeat-like protein [Aspergillus campestris IBT 28561]
MARESTAPDPSFPRLLQPQGSNHTPSGLPASRPSSTPFRLDEGYSDETKSLPDKELFPAPTNDGMTVPGWLLANSEEERAELAYNLLRTVRTSTVAAVVDRLAPLLHMDPVFKLPPEITSEIFSYLDPHTLLTASLASRAWRGRIFDSRLWRDLYIGEGWRVDIDKIHSFEQAHSGLPSPQSRKSRPRHTDTDSEEPKQKKRVPPSWLDSRSTDASLQDNGPHAMAEADTEGDYHMSDALIDRSFPSSAEDQSLGRTGSSSSSSSSRDSQSEIMRPMTDRSTSPTSNLLLRFNSLTKINWPHLYRQRRRLEENWNKGRFTNFQLPHPAHMDEAHQECVYAIQFSGRWLVSGSRDRTVRVWDLNTKRLFYRPLVGHTKSVLCLQFDARPQQDVIISGSSDKNVIIWRFSTGQKIHEIERAHNDSVLNLRFDDRFLVTCSKDKLIKVWNRRTLAPTDPDYPVTCRSSGVTYPSYIVDTSEIPSPILEAQMARDHIRTLAPYALLMTLEGHGAAVNAIQISDDEIVSASGDRLIKIWSLRSGACKKTLVGHEKGIACVQFDNRRIISGSNDDSVRIFDHVSGAEVACLRGHLNLVRTVQAGFGDPPGAEEAMRLEALAVDNQFWDAHRAGAPVDLGPGALRRAGHTQNTAGSRNPRDIKALGATIPPGGGGSKWGRIVSGSYDESIIIWKKDNEGHWVVGQRLRQADAADNIANTHLGAAHGPVRGNAFAQQAQAQAQARAQARAQAQRAVQAGASTPTLHPAVASIPAPAVPAARTRISNPSSTHRSPTSRVFKLQFDARKIICASQDPRIIGWDFVAGDNEIEEACQFFKGL